MDQANGEPLLGEGERFSRKRQHKDVAWGGMYILLLAALAAGGVYAFTHR